MAFKEQKTSTTRTSAKGISATMLDDEAYQEVVNNALDALSTQQAKILWLHSQGWSPKQMQILLRTAGGGVTPVQHVNQVLAKARKA
jgi:hypothetical protein